MQTRKLAHADLEVSCVGFGLASLPSWTPGPVTGDDVDRVERLMQCALDAGITLFDTASPYALGRSETVMGRVFERAPAMRAKAIVQTKCGQILCDDEGQPIRPCVDISKREIIASAERSLRRLKRDYIDILLLHQPTPLMQPEEIADAFSILHAGGKVRYFGLSNFSATQAKLIQQAFSQRLVVNQVQLSLYHPHHILDGMGTTLSILEHLDTVYQRLTGASAPPPTRRWTPASEGMLDFCRLEGVQVQAWSPLRHKLPGAYQPHTNFAALDATLATIADALGTQPAAVALAWLLKHPAGIVPIMSTSSPEHLTENAQAASLSLSDDDWYALLRESVLAVESR